MTTTGGNNGRLQVMITDNGVQVWEKEELAAQWGFNGSNLGFAETGLGMDDDVLASLPFPQKEVLLEYARRAFTKPTKPSAHYLTTSFIVESEIVTELRGRN